MIIFKRYWLSIILVIVILVLCFMNPSEVPVTIPMPNFDKLVHCLMFLGLSGVMFFDSSFRFKQKVNGWLFLGACFLFPIALGGGIEIGQAYLTTTRTGDWMDFLFDVIGVFGGCLVGLMINRRLKMK